MYNNSTDWGLFQENVRNNLRLNISLKTEQEIKDATNDFTITIQRAAWSASPITTKNVRQEVNIPNEILQLVRAKRRARAKWPRSRNPVDKNLYIRLTNNLKTKINAVKQETYRRYLSQLSTTDNIICKLGKKGKSPQTTNLPIRTPTGDCARSDHEKAELFDQHFKEVFKPHSDDLDPEIETYLDSPLQMSMPIKNFTFTEVQQQIQKLNIKKAPGFELINGKVLSELPKEGIKFLVHLYNVVLRLKYWSLQLKFGQITLVQKPGKPPHEVTSYRPISLLPIISKILEKLRTARLKKITSWTNWSPITNSASDDAIRLSSSAIE